MGTPKIQCTEIAQISCLTNQSLGFLFPMGGQSPALGLPPGLNVDL